MSPRSTITTAPEPLLPRQIYDPNDIYGLSSLYSKFSVLYPDAYSSLFVTTDDAAMRSYYSSLLKSFSLTDYALPPLTTTRTGASRIGSSITGIATTRTKAQATSTGALASETTRGSDGEGSASGGGGLSTGAKVGIGIGVAVGVLVLVGLGICLWCMGKRKGKKSSTTVVAPTQPNAAAQLQPQTEYTGAQGYIPGTLHPQQQQQQFIPNSTQYAPPYQGQQQPGTEASHWGYEKREGQNAVELEHEYHFAKPGVIEIGDGIPEPSRYPERKD